MEGKASLVSRCGGPLGVSLLLLTIVSYLLILYAAAYPITLLYGFVAVCNAVLLILHILIALFRAYPNRILFQTMMLQAKCNMAS